MSGYRSLTPRQRYQIEVLNSKKTGVREIARDLGVNASTISRELRRFSSTYSAEKAIGDSRVKILRRVESNRKITGFVKAHVDQLILNDWSPEQAEETIKREANVSVSLKTIIATSSETN